MCWSVLLCTLLGLQWCLFSECKKVDQPGLMEPWQVFGMAIPAMRPAWLWGFGYALAKGRWVSGLQPGHLDTWRTICKLFLDVSSLSLAQNIQCLLAISHVLAAYFPCIMHWIVANAGIVLSDSRLGQDMSRPISTSPLRSTLCLAELSQDLHEMLCKHAKICKSHAFFCGL